MASLFSCDAIWQSFCRPKANSVGTTYWSRIFSSSSIRLVWSISLINFGFDTVRSTELPVDVDDWNSKKTPTRQVMLEFERERTWSLSELLVPSFLGCFGLSSWTVLSMFVFDLIDASFCFERSETRWEPSKSNTLGLSLFLCFSVLVEPEILFESNCFLYFCFSSWKTSFWFDDSCGWFDLLVDLSTHFECVESAFDRSFTLSVNVSSASSSEKIFRRLTCRLLVPGIRRPAF